MQTLINRLSSNPNRLFLLDGIGAFVSAFFLGIVLVNLESQIRMPIQILYMLAVIALVFAGYSITCYFINPKNWKSYLRLITTANTLYCTFTLGLVMYFFERLTLLAITYFVVEMIVVSIVIRIEILVISKN